MQYYYLNVCVYTVIITALNSCSVKELEKMEDQLC